MVLTSPRNGGRRHLPVHGDLDAGFPNRRSSALPDEGQGAGRDVGSG